MPSTSQKLSVLDYEFNVDVPCLTLPRQIVSILSESEDSESPSKNKETNNEGRDQSNNLTSLLKMESLFKIGYFQDSNLFEPFQKMIQMLWHLWEKILLNKSVALLSDKPSSASHGVLGALSLISPLEFASPYKPYLTVYDTDFPVIQKALESKTLGCLILGATNPLFLKVFKNFPCLVNLQESYSSQIKKMNTYIVPDRNFSKQMMNNVTEEKIAINQALLRKYFRRFTQTFLSKFDGYFALQINDLKRFEKQDFLKFLKKQQFEFQECFESKSDILRLYQEFCDSANCRLYLNRRHVMRIVQKA